MTHENIVYALQKLCPGTQWTLRGDDLSGLVWMDDPTKRPPDDAITATANSAPVPDTVSAMQAKVALSRVGKLDQAQTWVGTQSAEIQLIWNTAPTFSRNSALINSAAAALGWSQTDLDQLFIAANQINP